MRLRVFFGLMGLGLVTSGLFGQTPAPEQVIRIAVQAPLTGDQAAKGEQIRRGAQMAIDAAAGRLRALGYSVKLVSYNDENSAGTAQANARRIAADQSIWGVVGHLSEEAARSSIGEYHQGKILFVAPLARANDLTNQQFTSIFRVAPRVDSVALGAADFLAKELRAKQIAVLADRNPNGKAYGTLVRERLAALGRPIPDAAVALEVESANLAETLNRLLKAKPDALYLSVDGTNLEVVLKTLGDAKMVIPVVLDRPSLPAEAGKIKAALHGPVYFTQLPSQLSQVLLDPNFNYQFQNRFGANLSMEAAYAFDAAQTILGAVEAALKAKNPTRDGVAKAATALTLVGITGPLSFDTRGDLANPRILIYRFDPSLTIERQVLNSTIKLSPIKPNPQP